ncbi:MAG: hypothetical protein PHR47_00115 [Candidatus Pacebacteria bacterium]|nr:hypothetical protein [Candidatus Paceibacterota bacterium]
MKQDKKAVFFGCSMRGDNSYVARDDLLKIIDVIEHNNCYLVSKHQTKENILGEENLIDVKNIHDRDYEWLLEADFGVFEVSNPSLGVGAEISDMMHLGKPVFCFYKFGLDNFISAYIRGKKSTKYFKGLFMIEPYNSVDDFDEKFKKMFDLV